MKPSLIPYCYENGQDGREKNEKVKHGWDDLLASDENGDTVFPIYANHKDEKSKQAAEKKS